MERHDQDLSYKKRRLDSSITGAIPNPKSEDGTTVVQSDSTAAKFSDNVVYRLYIKGLVVEGKERTAKAGFGVAICDEKDNLLYEIKESLISISRREVEIIALIRGLSESFDLGIRHVLVYCDDHKIYQYIIGRGKVKEKIVHHVDEVQRLLENMASSDVVFVARNDVKFAFRLAREAIGSQSSISSNIDMKAEQGEICVICFEETVSEFFTDKCLHRHCFSCVKQHVEVKLRSGNVPMCLDYGCEFELTLESCSKVLTFEMIEMWKQKMKEDSIPAAERIYCPYPNCSMLMSKTELVDEASEQSNVRTCVKCCGLFCIDCKVPSHSDLSCADYKKLHPEPLVDDLKLQFLASDNMWRQCVKCRHLIELSHGCNHMTCRCGYEFCYKCGIEWKKDQQSCPSGCIQMEHGEDEDDDDDEDEGYYDEDGVRWPNYEDYIDHQTEHYDAPLDDDDVVYKDPSPEQFFSEEENADDDSNDDN